MNFDDGYDTGDVVRVFFGHAAGGDESFAFARKDLVVIGDRDDELRGHVAQVSDKTRQSLHKEDPDDDPTNDVRVKAEVVAVRKSAVVMRRDFGRIGDEDVTVTKGGDYLPFDTQE